MGTNTLKNRIALTRMLPQQAELESLISNEIVIALSPTGKI